MKTGRKLWKKLYRVRYNLILLKNFRKSSLRFIYTRMSQRHRSTHRWSARIDEFHKRGMQHEVSHFDTLSWHFWIYGSIFCIVVYKVMSLCKQIWLLILTQHCPEKSLSDEATCKDAQTFVHDCHENIPAMIEFSGNIIDAKKAKKDKDWKMKLYIKIGIASDN